MVRLDKVTVDKVSLAAADMNLPCQGSTLWPRRIELVFQTRLTLFFQLSEHLSQLVYQLTSDIPTNYELLVSRKNENYKFLVLILTADVSFCFIFYIWKLQRFMICTLLLWVKRVPCGHLPKATLNTDYAT